MLGCIFWVSPISVQHISLQPTRSNHTVQSIQNESTPGCYVRLSLLSLSHLRPTHLPPANQIKPHHSINPEWKYPWLVAMLGCLFWVSPISVQHISLQPTRSNHTIQSIQNESTPGCYVRLYLLSLSPSPSNTSPSSWPDQTTPFNQSRMKVPLGAMLGCLFWVSPISVQHISSSRPDQTTPFNQSRMKVPLGAMLGCLFWVSSRPDQTTPFNQSRIKVPLGAMLGCT